MLNTQTDGSAPADETRANAIVHTATLVVSLTANGTLTLALSQSPDIAADFNPSNIRDAKDRAAGLVAALGIAAYDRARGWITDFCCLSGSDAKHTPGDHHATATCTALLPLLATDTPGDQAPASTPKQ